MDIYHFHPDSGEYLGLGQADPDPLVRGNWLIPACATTETPPAIGPRQAAVYRDGWIIVSDFRGYRYWLADGSEHVIDQLGETPPSDALDAPPPPPEPEPEPPPPPPTLDQVKAEKIELMQAAYASNMYAGFESDALGTPHLYASDPESLIKLLGAVICGENVDYECVDAATKVSAILTHTPAQMRQVLLDGKRLAENYKHRLNDRLQQISAASTIDEVNAIVW
ncbi:MAG TPA: hypothetical protein VF193_14090 [Steroidobacter sp.]